MELLPELYERVLWLEANEFYLNNNYFSRNDVESASSFTISHFDDDDGETREVKVEALTYSYVG